MAKLKLSRCMVRNPVTDLIYGKEDLDAAGIAPGERFAYITSPAQIMRTGRFLVKCRSN